MSIFIFVPITPEMRSILLGAVVIVVLGVVDDIMAPACDAEICGADCGGADSCAERGPDSGLSNPNIFSSNAYWVLDGLSIPFTVLWIVAITNSVNLIDGLDGLCQRSLRHLRHHHAADRSDCLRASGGHGHGGF